MKKSISICFFVFLISFFSGCKKDEPAKLADVTTAPVTNITATTATCGSNISSDGGAVITAKGVCWGEAASPSINNSKTSDGTATGQSVSEITGLTAGTTYHVRAYATNSVGTAYGSDLTFSTLGKLPSSDTQPATNVSAEGAKLNGSVNANDLSTIVSFEYGTTISYGSTITGTQSPVTGNTITNISADVSELSAGTTYHFRIKAVNSLGTTYGSDLTFITFGQIPTVTTLSATSVGATGATLNGSVNANEVSTTVSFEYGATISYGSNATATQSPITGNALTTVSADISGLTAGATYHFRVKAVNSIGTTYGSDMTFVYTVTDIEGNIYSIITIDTKVWMKENLKTTKYSNGETITDSYAYNNNITNVATYGRLYTWYAVNDNRKICPTGWHVASQSEFTSLSSKVTTAAEFKEPGTVHWQTPNTGATNSIGFTALPGGYYTGSSYIYLYQQACFWLSDQASATLGVGVALYYNNLPTTGDLLNWPKGRALSVRCIKD